MDIHYDNVRHDLRNAFFTVFLAKYSNILLQIIILSILARLLSPEEFGIVSVVTVFITFFVMLSNIGFNKGVIQSSSLTKDDYSSIFYFSIIMSIPIAVLFYLFMMIISVLYGNWIYRHLSIYFLFVIIFSSASSIPSAVLIRDKNFVKTGSITIISTIISGSAAIIMACNGFSYYAIVYQALINSFIIMSLLIIASKIRLINKFNFQPVRTIFKYSLYNFLFNFFTYFTRNSDNIIIGKALGPESLGYYDKAYRLMMYPINNITGIFNDILHPIFARHQDNLALISDAYLKIIKLLLYISIPISMTMFFSSHEIIMICFGKNWLNSVLIFKILSISIWIQMIFSTNGTIFLAINKTKEMFYMGLFTNIVFVTMILLGLSKGLTGVATNITISFYLVFIPTFCYLFVCLKTNVFKLFILFIKPFLMFCITGLIMHFSLPYLHFNVIINLLCKSVLIGCISFIFIFLSGDYTMFLALLKKKM